MSKFASKLSNDKMKSSLKSFTFWRNQFILSVRQKKRVFKTQNEFIQSKQKKNWEFNEAFILMKKEW